MSQIFLHHVATRTFAGGHIFHDQTDDVEVLSDADANRQKGVTVDRSPTPTDRIAAGASGRPVFVEVRAQQEQQEGNTNDRARGVQKGVLDVGTREECGKGGRREDTVRVKFQPRSLVSPTSRMWTHVSSEADSAKTFNTRQT